jgi:hypothetical protein
VSWKSPYNGGSPITAYQIQVRESDSTTYSSELTNCDGSQSKIVTEKKCTILYDTLLAAPFSLPWGTSVYVKVTAINIMGSSLASSAGNGAVMVREPDAPSQI